MSRSLRYDPACKYCRRIDHMSRAVIYILGGVLIGYNIKPGWPQVWVGLFFLLICQPVFWIANKVQPMSHHLLAPQEPTV